MFVFIGGYFGFIILVGIRSVIFFWVLILVENVYYRSIWMGEIGLGNISSSNVINMFN